MTRKEQIRAYKAEGHTSKETAEAFGLSADYVRKVCVGIAPQGYAKGSMKGSDEVNRFIEERVPGCEYAGNYTGADGRVDLRCKECGTIFNRSMISVRKRRCSCPTCRDKALAIRRKNREAALFEKKQRREALLLQKEIEKAERAKQIEIVFHACPVCGELTTRPKYCSDDCCKKANNSTKDARRRKKIQNAMVDKDITVMGLFKRDAGICYLCGERCNTEDYVMRGKNFIAGDWYPSIDHVVPLAKGGEHSWNNVRLAHRRCNSLKSDKFAGD